MVSMGTNNKIKCPTCGGHGDLSGTIIVQSASYEGTEVDIEADCPDCDGLGYVSPVCDHCGAEGGVVRVYQGPHEDWHELWCVDCAKGECIDCAPEGGPCRECSHRDHAGCPCF